MNFGEALLALKEGMMIARVGWNGKDLFIFRQVPAEINKDIVPSMQSLPQAVKGVFKERGMHIYYSNQLALVDSGNNISGWSPSTADALADDWFVYEI